MGDYPSYPYPAGALDGSELLLVYRGGRNERVPGSLFANRKGDPGGNALSIGTLLQASSLAMPAGVDLVKATGLAAVGDAGVGMELVYDPMVDGAFVAAHPRSSFRDAAGRGYRRVVPDLKPNDLVGNGVASDCDALLAAGAAMVLTAGTYRVDRDITLSGSIALFPGARFLIVAGATLTITGSLTAGITQIFLGGGRVDLTRSSITQGYPEWFGAIPNDGAADCAPAIMACYRACRTMRFVAADYYCNVVATPLIFDLPHKRVLGAGARYNGAVGQCTRLLGKGPTANVLQIGPSVMPAGGFNAFPQDIEVRDLWVARTAAPDIASGCVSIVHQFTLHALIVNVTAAESISGWRVAGVVNARHILCNGFRSLPGSGSGADKWVLWDLDGTAALGAAGGNASVRLLHCNGTFGGAPPANSIACFVHGAWTDSFIVDFENAGGAVGIRVIGLGGTSVNLGGNTDLLIWHPVCDQNTVAPLYVSDGNHYGSLEIAHPYGGPANPAGGKATAAIFVKDNLGVVRITGGQVPMLGAPGVPAVIVQNSRKWFVEGTVALEVSGAPTFALDGARNGKLTGIANNEGARAKAVVQLKNSSRNVIEPFGCGGQDGSGTGLFDLGIQVLDAASQYNSFDPTGIDPDAVAGGAPNKLVINGRQIGATGTDAASMSWVSGVLG